MLLSLALGCSLLTALAAWRSWRLAIALSGQQRRLHRHAALLQEARRYQASRSQLATAQQLSESAVDLGTHTVRTVHEGIAAIPFAVLESIPGVREPARAVRVVHDAIAGGVYDSIKAVNQIVGKGLRGEFGNKEKKNP